MHFYHNFFLNKRMLYLNKFLTLWSKAIVFLFFEQKVKAYGIWLKTNSNWFFFLLKVANCIASQYGLRQKNYHMDQEILEQG
jgi:hypothetical protein